MKKYMACGKASNVTGYAKHTIRNWMQTYMQSILSLLSNGKDDTTDTDVQEILASERGQSSHKDCLLFDEDFKLNACTFVRRNASKKVSQT